MVFLNFRCVFVTIQYICYDLLDQLWKGKLKTISGEQWAKCSKSYDTMDDDKSEMLEKSHADMGELKLEWIKYCEIHGAFVFYSEPYYQVLQTSGILN